MTPTGEPVARSVNGSELRVTGRELRITVTAVATPEPAGLRLRRCTDLISVTRTDGRVTGSTRLPGYPEHPLAGQRHHEVDQALRALSPLLPVGERLRPQSVLVTAAQRLQVLTRWESALGPVLVGGSGPDALTDLLSALAGVREVCTGPVVDPPIGWAGRPLLLRPCVAAVLLVGVRWVLASAAAARLDGRRVLPEVTLLDRPIEHAEGAPDDDGRTAATQGLVRGGRVELPPVEPSTGLPTGRALWCHDLARLGAVGTFGLTVAAQPVQDEPDDGLELVRCVEGLRRYTPDGQLRMVCLARAGPGAGTFPITVQARPLSMLRTLTGLTGSAEKTYSDHPVETPSLLLASAAELMRSSHAQLTPL